MHTVFISLATLAELANENCGELNFYFKTGVYAKRDILFRCFFLN